MQVHGRPSMGAEDFADYLGCVPGCMIRLGVNEEEKKLPPCIPLCSISMKVPCNRSAPSLKGRSPLAGPSKGKAIPVMLIAFGYNISLSLELASAVLFSLKVDPSRRRDLVSGENFRIEPKIPFEEYLDGYGNQCGRVPCKPGVVRFFNRGVLCDSGQLDPFAPHARQDEISGLPTDFLIYLLPSRYCETDSELSDIARAYFAGSPARMGAGSGNSPLCSLAHQIRLSEGAR